jgi:hypothetical protein
MDYLFPSLLFVKEHIGRLLEDIHYSEGRLEDAVNYINNSIALNECNRIMLSNDSYSKKSLKLIVLETIKQYLSDYQREHKHSLAQLRFNYDDELEKLNSLFWKLVSEVN